MGGGDLVFSIDSYSITSLRVITSRVNSHFCHSLACVKKLFSIPKSAPVRPCGKRPFTFNICTTYNFPNGYIDFTEASSSCNNFLFKCPMCKILPNPAECGTVKENVFCLSSNFLSKRM